MAPIVSVEHKEKRKLIILQAAKEVFIKKGYNATTIQDIINHSGVSRGGVYTYFQNTEQIFLEILRRRDLEDEWNLESIYNLAQTNWGALTFLLDQIQEIINSQSNLLLPAIYEYYFTIGWQTKKHIPLLEARIKQAMNGFISIIEKGKNEKEFSPILPIEDIAGTILTFCDGIYVNCFHLGPEKSNVYKQFQAFRSYLALALFKNN
ncbi:TetR family transcriptional regulator [Bacillus sp. 1P10SD]|uniref:TetR family transcriptional regulator n=1 Tax=Bacillus sp. 1P10SD TaxID=3132265 RepID=UPI0039A58A49